MKPQDPTLEEGVDRAVQAVLAGDRSAFALIVEQFQDSVMTTAITLLHDRQAAAELTQDVFVRAYERLASYNLSRPLRPWLIKITYRLAQDRWRDSQARDRHLRQVQQHMDCSQSVLPLDDLIADERNRRLWQAVQTLPLAERTAVTLYYREGLSVEEVASATDVSAGTVKTLLFRARSRLREYLQSD